MFEYRMQVDRDLAPAPAALVLVLGGLSRSRRCRGEERGIPRPTIISRDRASGQGTFRPGRSRIAASPIAWTTPVPALARERPFRTSDRNEPIRISDECGSDAGRRVRRISASTDSPELRRSDVQRRLPRVCAFLDSPELSGSDVQRRVRQICVSTDSLEPSRSDAQRRVHRVCVFAGLSGAVRSDVQTRLHQVCLSADSLESFRSDAQIDVTNFVARKGSQTVCASDFQSRALKLPCTCSRAALAVLRVRATSVS